MPSIFNTVIGKIALFFTAALVSFTLSAGASAPHTPLPQTQAAAVALAPATPAQSTSAQPAPDTSNFGASTTVVYKYVYPPAPEQQTVAAGVTEDELTQKLQALKDQLTALIGPTANTAAVPEYVAAGGNPTNSYAAANAINNLSNVTITNANLTAAEIPDLSATYLPLSGGTVTGNLTVSGTITGVASSTNSNTVNATTTNLFATNASTTNATSTSLFASLGHFTTGVIDSLTSTAATIGNLVATTINGTNLVAINATTTNATSTNLYAAAAMIPTLTGTNATFAGATSTNFFATTASSTNLYSTSGAIGVLSLGTLSLSNALTVANGGTGLSNVASGAVLFGNGSAALATSTNLFWDAANSRLGIGTSSPATTLSVSGNSYLTGGLGIGLLNTTGGTLQTSGNASIGGSLSVLPLTTIPWHDVSQSPIVNAEQGYAFDGTYNYLFSTNRIDKRDNTGSWTLVTSNPNPDGVIPGANHQGDGDVYNGLLYSPVMTFGSCTSFSNENILISNASDLIENSVVDISAQGQDASSIAIDPGLGSHGTIFVSAFCNSTKIAEYDLSTYAFLGYLTLAAPILNIQGIAYNSSTGLLYAASNNGGLYSVDISTGAVTLLYTRPGLAEPEGLDYHGATLGWVINPGSDDVVHFISPESAFTVTSKGNVGIGTSSPQARLSITGSDTSASSLAFLAADSNNAAIFTVLNSGKIGIGTTTPTTQLHIVSNTTNQFGATIRLQTVGGTTNGDFFVGSTDNSWNTGANKLVFGAGTPGTSNVKMVMTNTGSLGIGTTSPFTKLHVEGNYDGGDYDTLANTILEDAEGHLQLVSDDSGNHAAALVATSLHSSWVIESRPTAQNNRLSIGHYTSTGNADIVGHYTELMSISSSGNVGIGTTTPYSRLEVWGPDTASTSAFAVVNNASTTAFAVYDTGNAVLAGGLTQSSDQRLKTNIQSLDASSSLAAIAALNPVTFNWIDPNKGTEPQLGFIAQQVLPIFPNLVSTTSATTLTPNGTLSLNYIGLIAPMVKAIQEIASISGSFKDALVAWLGSAANGIHDLYAGVIHANDGHFSNELCVSRSNGSELCVTGDQLAALFAANGASAVQISDPTISISGISSSTPPTITLIGNDPATIHVGDAYTDLGATAKDSAGHDLGFTYFINGTPVSTIAIDTSTVATDTIDYVATDTWGNTATSTRTVIIEPGVQAPAFSTDSAASTTSSGQ